MLRWLREAMNFVAVFLLACFAGVIFGLCEWEKKRQGGKRCGL